VARLARGALRSARRRGRFARSSTRAALHALLRKQPADSGYATKLLAAFRGGAAAAKPAAQRSPLIQSLNVRELQILRLVEVGLVNKDISSALSIGLDTVKCT